jgi:Trk K+ transport system NAD-binding subunit
VPHHEEVESFKGDLTNIGVIMLFILLSAGLRFDTFATLSLGGWGGVLAVLAMMVLVRPFSVLASMVGTTVTRKETLYMAALGPRGVVAVALALFAELELRASGYEGADSFVGLVFLTIIGTVVIQGLYSSPLAHRLGVTAMNVLVVGSGGIARELARRLTANGAAVTLISADPMEINQAQIENLPVRQGNGTSSDDLRKAGIEKASAFVAATASDKTNLLACQIAMQRFGVENVSSRVNSPDNLDNFSSLGIKVVSPAISTAMLLDSLVRRPAALELISSQVPGQEICEVELQNHRLIGKPLREWSILEGDVLVAMVRRNGDLFVPHGQTMLEKGDTLTLIGKCEDVDFAQDVVKAQ